MEAQQEFVGRTLMSDLLKIYAALIEDEGLSYCTYCSSSGVKVFHKPGNHIKEGATEMDATTVQITAEDVDGALLSLIDQVRGLRQDESNPEKARTFAITVTELEKLEAFFQVHCL
jgi:hypothetical protein